MGIGNTGTPIADPSTLHEAAPAEPEAVEGAEGAAAAEADAEAEAEAEHEAAPTASVKQLFEEERSRIKEILDAQREKMDRQEAALAEHTALLDKHKTLLEAVKDQQATIEKQLKNAKTDLADRIGKLEQQQASRAASAASTEQTTQNEISLLRQKLAELDMSMGKVKTLWLNFDERVKGLESFTGTILAPFTGGQDHLSGTAMPEIDVDLDPSGNSDGSDGKRGQKRKR